MKKLLLLNFIFLFGACLDAQNKAIDSLVNVSQNAKEDTNKVNAFNQLSQKAGIRLGNYDTALYFARNAKQLAEKCGFKKGLAKANLTIGITYYLQGKYNDAMQYYSSALESSKEISDKKGSADAYQCIGNIYFERASFLEAINYHLASLKIQEEIGDQKGISGSYNNIGNAYYSQGNYSEALKNYLISLESAKLSGNKRRIAEMYNNIGNVQYVRCNYSQAMKNYIGAKKTFEALGDKPGVATTYANIGMVYTNQGNYSDALKNGLLALNLRTEIGDRTGLINCYNNLGALYSDMGDYSKALGCFSKSFEISEETGDKGSLTLSVKALIYCNIGGVFSHQKNYVKALENYQFASKIGEEINDKVAIIFSYNGIAGDYLSKQSFDSSIYFSKKALKTSEEIRMLDQMKFGYRILTQAFALNGQTDSAALYLSRLKNTMNRSLSFNYFTLSEAEKEKYFALMEDDYGLYNNFALAHHDKFPNLADTTYNLALVNKGLSLKSSTAMRQAILGSADTALIREYENWMILKQSISKAYESGRDTKDEEEQINEIERKLVEKSSAFNDFEKIRNLDWKKVQSALKPNEAAIEFVHFISQLDTMKTIIYAAIIVRKESQHPEIIRLCTEAELGSILGNLQENNLNFVNNVYGTRKKAQKSLYEKVWQPLEHYLKDIKYVNYSPSGLLHKISFSALSKENDVFLCDIYELHRQGSTGKITLPGSSAIGENENYTLMGGVQYDTHRNMDSVSEMWAYLPGTLSETQAINLLLLNKKRKVNSYTAKEANESCLKQIVSTTQILHIATHGFFYPDPEQLKIEQKSAKASEVNVPVFRGGQNGKWSFEKSKNPLMRSGIVLAGANDAWDNEHEDLEDGLLTALEVSNLNMKGTKLVVLSACETGLGDIKGSEGVFGLQRAFKMAGTQNLVMSLWQVPDKETSEFMQLFYSNLLKAKDIKKAFNQTQHFMRKKYDPYYWAAFVLQE